MRPERPKAPGPFGHQHAALTSNRTAKDTAGPPLARRNAVRGQLAAPV